VQKATVARLYVDPATGRPRLPIARAGDQPRP
jgi:hypothetical protein